MATDARVCPFCGDPPGDGVFCAACGRNLAGVERLPTRAEWAAEHAGAAAPGDGAVSPERCASATEAFLAAMHAAGDPGTTTVDLARGGIFRTPKVEGWVVRAVERDDEARPRRYEPGLLLDTGGAYHRLDNDVRGWGQRDFPVYHHTAAADPLPVPAERRLLDELDAVLRANGVR